MRTRREERKWRSQFREVNKYMKSWRRIANRCLSGDSRVWFGTYWDVEGLSQATRWDVKYKKYENWEMISDCSPTFYPLSITPENVLKARNISIPFGSLLAKEVILDLSVANSWYSWMTMTCYCHPSRLRRLVPTRNQMPCWVFLFFSNYFSATCSIRWFLKHPNGFGHSLEGWVAALLFGAFSFLEGLMY